MVQSVSLTVETTSFYELVDLTERVQALVPTGFDGVCVLFIKHTTAALTLAALPDGAGEDLIEALPMLVPALDFKHQPPEHVPGHILSAVIGASVTVPVRTGRLELGDVQSVVLLEFQGPASRTVQLSFVG